MARRQATTSRSPPQRTNTRVHAHSYTPHYIQHARQRTSYTPHYIQHARQRTSYTIYVFEIVKSHTPTPALHCTLTARLAAEMLSCILIMISKVLSLTCSSTTSVQVRQKGPMRAIGPSSTTLVQVRQKGPMRAIGPSSTTLVQVRQKGPMRSVGPSSTASVQVRKKVLCVQ